MALFAKARRESQAAFEHWTNRFGHFENLHGVRQSIWEITERVQAAVGAGSPGELRERSRRFAEHADAQRQLAEDARMLSRLLDRAWTGDAAVTAQTKFTAFVTDAQDTASTLDTNSNNLASEAQAFADLAAAMKPLPPMEATKRWLLSEPSWTKEFLANWEFENDRIHHAHENLQAYENYHQATEHNMGQVSTDYPRLPGLPPDSELSAAAGGPDTAPAGWLGTGPGTAGTQPWTSSRGAGYPSGSYPGVGPAYPSGSPGLPEGVSSGTTAASFRSPDLGRGGGPAEIRPTGGGFGPSGGGPGSGGGFGPTGGAARGFGPTGAGQGASGGESRGGRVSGIAAQAGGARAAGAGQPMRGPAGASGMGAPMGGAGRGQGGEDEEYRGRGFLEEPDPDGLFGVGEPTVPPVIGEGWD